MIEIAVRFFSHDKHRPDGHMVGFLSRVPCVGEHVEPMKGGAIYRVRHVLHSLDGDEPAVVVCEEEALPSF